MKFRFLGVIIVIANLAFGQQSNRIDSLSATPVEKVLDSIPLPRRDSLKMPVDKKILDSFVRKELDTISVDSLSPKKDSLTIVKDSLKLGKPKKKKQGKRRVVRRRLIEIDTVSLINNYKAYYEDGREEVVDTTLTIQKDYKFNFLRKDYFELLPLANVAEGFNRMGYDFREQPMGPKLGARVNQFGFFESKDIPYYEVATPLTELFFRTTFEQGELVDALVTVNPSPKFNLMVAYKGLRSLGRYQSSRSNGGQFRGSVNFNDAQERYQLRAHFVAQTRENQVNGGLDDQGVYFFENAPYYPEIDAEGNAVLDENGEVVEVFYDGFLDRSRLSTNIRATSILSGRRFYLGQTYQLKQKSGDSLKQPLRVGNRFTYESRFYEFDQNSTISDFFGTIDPAAESVFDRSDLKTLTNETFLEAKLPFVGKSKIGMQFKRWDFAHGRTANSTNTTYLGQQTNQLALQAQWKNNTENWSWGGQVHHSLLTKLKTHHYELYAQRKLFKDWDLSVNTQYRSQPQNFNFYHYESDYVDLNWDQPDLKNTERFSVYGTLGHTRWLSLQAEWHRIQNYTYFRSTTRLADWGEKLEATPFQSKDELQYLKLRLYNQLNLGKFSLTNTVQYQRVLQLEAARSAGEFGEPQLLNVPEWITRNTIAFSSEIFNKALFLQTGFHFQFFTGFYADAMHSVLGEYVNQNNQLIGEYPRIDFFINAKISQTRLFLKVEHLNNTQTGYRYYAAPFFPYRDMSVRFGVVWNFFQ